MNTLLLFFVVLFATIGIFCLGIFAAIMLYNYNRFFKDWCDTWSNIKFDNHDSPHNSKPL